MSSTLTPDLSTALNAEGQNREEIVAVEARNRALSIGPLEGSILLGPQPGHFLFAPLRNPGKRLFVGIYRGNHHSRVSEEVRNGFRNHPQGCSDQP